jgi:ribosomal protein S18 acetylase RimI-like enzyme
MASTYHHLPFPNLTFAAERADLVEALLRTLADRNPRLRQGPAYALLPEERHGQLARHAQILEAPIEYQMVIEPETLRRFEGHPTRRLTDADAPAMDALAQAAGLTAWHRGALALGPAYGCFADGRLVAMAATHFATPDVIEIGHIATHPDYRRRGYASACTVALTRAAFRLAPRVFLMVLAQNTPALATYKRLGFRAIEHFYLTRFVLS